jgi:hypothetical protein
VLAEAEDDEQIITLDQGADETLGINGADRKHPAIVRRVAYSKDRSRSTIQVISRYKRDRSINPIYDAYQGDIEAYRSRRDRRLASARGDSEIGDPSTHPGWIGDGGADGKGEADPGLLRSGYMDPRLNTEVILAKGGTDEISL